MNKPNENFFEYQERLRKDPIEHPSLDPDDEEIDDEPLDLSEVPSDGPKSVEDILVEMDDEVAFSTPFSGITAGLYVPGEKEPRHLRVRRTERDDVVELLLTVYSVNPGHDSRILADNVPVRINRDDRIFVPDCDAFFGLEYYEIIDSVSAWLESEMHEVGLDVDITSAFKFLSDFLPED